MSEKCPPELEELIVNHGTWALIALVMLVLFVAVGWICKKRLFGILIDNRNKYSLSRLQIVLWTLVLVSAFFAVMLESHSVAIYLPPELWALMGISTGSAAAAVMIKDNKAQQKPAATEAARAAASAAAPDSNVDTPKGVLATAKTPSFSDFFCGDEIADEAWVDISKVQMFFFTIAAVFGYIWALAAAPLHKALSGLTTCDYNYFFPALSAAMVTLIAISHAGYLAVKASPKTPTAA